MAAGAIWFQFVNPALQQLTSDPLSTELPLGLIGASLGSWPGNPDLDIDIATGGPGGQSQTTMEISFDGELTTSDDDSISLVIADGPRVTTCDDVNVSLGNDKNFEDLNPQQKYMVTNYLRERSSRTNEGQDGEVLSDLEVSEKASKQNYQLLNFVPQRYDYFSQDAAGNRELKSGVNLDTTCAISASVGWVNRSPDSRFNAPVVAFAVGSREDSLTGLNSSVEVTAGQDLTMLRATNVQDTDRSTAEAILWTAPNSGWAVVGESKYITFDGLSAVFRSASFDRKNQNALFLAGVALGVVGSLVIAVLSNVFEFFWFAGSAFLRRVQRGFSRIQAALSNR